MDIYIFKIKYRFWDILTVQDESLKPCQVLVVFLVKFHQKMAGRYCYLIITIYKTPWVDAALSVGYVRRAVGKS